MKYRVSEPEAEASVMFERNRLTVSTAASSGISNRTFLGRLAPVRVTSCLICIPDVVSQGLSDYGLFFLQWQ